MATYSKIPLSQSTNGRAVLVSLSSSPPVLIHRTDTTSTNVDEVWLYASNITNIDSTITLYWGGSAATDVIFTATVQAYAGLVILVPGLILTGTGASSSAVYALCQQPSAIEITGYINKITA